MPKINLKAEELYVFKLSGSRVLIAGGSSEIGLSAAKILACCGATVVINGLDRLKLESA